MTLFEWIEVVAKLGVYGARFYPGFLQDDHVFLKGIKTAVEEHNLAGFGEQASQMLLPALRRLRANCRKLGNYPATGWSFRLAGHLPSPMLIVSPVLSARRTYQLIPHERRASGPECTIDRPSDERTPNITAL